MIAALCLAHPAFHCSLFLTCLVNPAVFLAVKLHHMVLRNTRDIWIHAVPAVITAKTQWIIRKSRSVPQKRILCSAVHPITEFIQSPPEARPAVFQTVYLALPPGMIGNRIGVTYACTKMA